MRVIAGSARRLLLVAPSGMDTRPTQDKIKETLFNILQPEIQGARFLDLFAGSGAIGIEALSRGAAEVAFVEHAPRSLACLSRNIAMLKVEAQCRMIRADAYEWLGRPAETAFDIAYADPPYAVGAEHGYATMLARLAEGSFVKPGGLFIAEMTSGQASDSAPAWELCRDRTYGQTRLAIYRRR